MSTLYKRLISAAPSTTILILSCLLTNSGTLADAFSAPINSTLMTDSSTSATSGETKEYIEKEMLQTIYWRAAYIGGAVGLIVSLLVSLITACIIYSVSKSKGEKYSTEYSRLLASHSQTASLASIAHTSHSIPNSPKPPTSTPKSPSKAKHHSAIETQSKKVKKRIAKTLPSRRSVLALSDPENTYASMNGVTVDTDSPKAVYKKKVSNAMQPPKLLSELKKKQYHGSMPNLAEFQGIKVFRQKSAEEVFSRPRANTEDPQPAARQSAIYTEPDSVTVRQGRRSQESEGTMYYNTNSILSISTDIYSMSDFTDMSRHSGEPHTDSHYAAPYIATSPTSNQPFKLGSVGYANGSYMINNRHHSDQLLSARELNKKPVLSSPNHKFPFDGKTKPRSNTGI